MNSRVITRIKKRETRLQIEDRNRLVILLTAYRTKKGLNAEQEIQLRRVADAAGA